MHQSQLTFGLWKLLNCVEERIDQINCGTVDGVGVVVVAVVGFIVGATALRLAVVRVGVTNRRRRCRRLTPSLAALRASRVTFRHSP